MRNKFIRTPSFWERNAGKVFDLILIVVSASLIGMMIFSNIFMK